MDGSSFDKLARLAATGAARRSVLKTGFALVLAGLGATSLFGAEDAAAKSCKKKCQDKKNCNDKKDNDAKQKCKAKCKAKCEKQELCIPKLPQAACQKSNDCCPETTRYSCGTSHGSGSNTCCGAQGAICGSTFDCCIDQCCINATCIPGPCP